MSEARNFDVVIYGASGFTGRLVVEYLTKTYGDDPWPFWAVAGRNTEKLRAVLKEVGAPGDTPVIEADAEDPGSLAAMAKSAKCVLTTVGPYTLYGEPLVKACAEAGTDYVDLCGEPLFMHEMIKEYSDAAKSSGARIVFSCGFDSIPFDLGVFYLQEEAKKKFGAPCPSVRGLIRGMKGTWSGGTLASGRATMAALKENPALFPVLTDPFALTPGYKGAAQPDGASVMEDPKLGWLAPFVMAVINTKNVHRSNFLMGRPYGDDFTYSEMVMTGPGEQGQATAKKVASDDGMMREDGPKPGEGPSREEREAGSYDILFVGETSTSEEIRASVKGDMDPGYGSTSKMLTEAALCLIKDRADVAGGVWTPAPALGAPLIKRLEEKAGLTFTLE